MIKYYIGYSFSHGGVIVDGPIRILSGKRYATKWKLKCPNCLTEEWKFTNTLQGKKFPCKKCYDNSMKRNDQVPAVKRAFISLKANAKSRDLLVEITEEDFYRIASLPCNYCGSDPVEKNPPKEWQAAALLNGIDRIDNSLGYTINNVCPCCEQCNWSKKDLSLYEWNEWINKLIKKKVKNDNY